MKVVHLVISDCGGAAKAAIRLSQAVKRNGEESEVVVLEKRNRNSDVVSFFPTKIHIYLWKALRHIIKFFWKKSMVQNKNQFFSFNGIGVSLKKNKKVREADILQIHWISNGYVTIDELLRYVNGGNKIVWTLHDMWAFTGGCHYTNMCEKYIDKCENCKCTVGQNQNVLKQQMKKKQLFANDNVTVVGCSRWMCDCARNSSVMVKSNIVCLHNCIDTQIFKASEKNKIQKLKEELHILDTQNCLLIGAMDLHDKRKGIEYVDLILKNFSNKNYVLLVFGKCSYQIETDVRQIYLGNVVEEKKLALFYSMADVFLAPSKEENLANTVLESISCGTPVVAFQIGGMQEMINHKENGYLAEPYDVADFCKGIEFCLEIKKYNRNREFNQYIEDRFGYSKISREYMKEYEKLLRSK